MSNSRAKKVSKQAKEDNASWRPRAHLHSQTSNSSNMFSMRASNSSDLTKTAVAVKLDENTALVKETYPDLVADIPTHRPAKVEALSQTGSPQVLVTPGKTQLFCDANLGGFKIFSNRRLASIAHSSDSFTIKRCLTYNETNEFKVSKAYLQIAKFNEAVKIQAMQVSARTYKKNDKEREKNDYVRKDTDGKCASQNNLMGGSAGDYAEAAAFSVKNVKWEWLHLIAHEIGGAAFQSDENLVAGTAHANTEMMLVESEIRYLSDVYKDGFTLEVKAELMEVPEENEHLQIATNIHYRILTPDFKIEFVFNAQNQQQPHRAFKEYVANYIRSHVLNKPKEKTATLTETQSETASPSGYSRVLFY